MFNFGLEITSVFCGTTSPELVAQYRRNIHFTRMKNKNKVSIIRVFVHHVNCLVND